MDNIHATGCLAAVIKYLDVSSCFTYFISHISHVSLWFVVLFGNFAF